MTTDGQFRTIERTMVDYVKRRGGRALAGNQ